MARVGATPETSRTERPEPRATALPSIAWPVVGTIAAIAAVFHLATANVAQPHQQPWSKIWPQLRHYG